MRFIFMDGGDSRSCGGNCRHLGAFDQQLEHDRQFAKQDRLEIEKELAL